MYFAGTTNYTSVLQEVKDKIVNQEQCEIWHRGNVDESMICFGAGNKNTCGVRYHAVLETRKSKVVAAVGSKQLKLIKLRNNVNFFDAFGLSAFM